MKRSSAVCGRSPCPANVVGRQTGGRAAVRFRQAQPTAFGCIYFACSVGIPFVGYAAVFVYEQHEQADDTDVGVVGGLYNGSPVRPAPSTLPRFEPDKAGATR